MGEFEFLARLRERLPEDGQKVKLGSGDDAAVTVPGGATATSIDALVEGVHFRRGEAEPAAVGRKALATALSDLAAMGAGTGEAYVALGVPGDLAEAELLGLLDGMLELAAATGTTLAGGDLTRAPALTLAVTVVGHAPGTGDFVTRGGARPGELVVLTGELGGAAAGRLLLDDPDLAAAVPAALAAELRERQLDPSPRLLSGSALAAAGARAMIDLSDGLASDAGHVAAASGVALNVEAARLRLSPGVAEAAAAAGLDPMRLAVSGGEDYELLATLPPEALEDACSRVAAAGEATIVAIGEVDEGEGVGIRLPGGERLEAKGYDHFAEPSRGSRSEARERRGG